MSVHVGEICTDVQPPAGPAGAASPGGPTPHLDADLEAWAQCRGEIQRLTRRTASEGFDD